MDLFNALWQIPQLYQEEWQENVAAFCKRLMDSRSKRRFHSGCKSKIFLDSAELTLHTSVLILVQVKVAFIRVMFIQSQKSNPVFRVGGKKEVSYFLSSCNFFWIALKEKHKCARRTAFLNKAMPA